MNEEKLLSDLKKLNGIERKVEVLINNFEQYITYKIEDKAMSTQKVIESNLNMLIAHLRNIRHHLKNPKEKKLIAQEEEILINLKATVEDISKNPDHLKQDNWKIHKLEELLKVVERKEEKAA